MLTSNSLSFCYKIVDASDAGCKKVVRSMKTKTDLCTQLGESHTRSIMHLINTSLPANVLNISLSERVMCVQITFSLSFSEYSSVLRVSLPMLAIF